MLTKTKRTQTGLILLATLLVLSCRSTSRTSTLQNTAESSETTGPALSSAKSYGSSANVETIQNSSPDHSLQTNENITIRPTATSYSTNTLSDCKSNVGIVEESYRLTNLLSSNQIESMGKWNTMLRPNCERVGLPYRFDQPGYYFIELKIKDSQGKKSEASMVVSVSSKATETVTDGFSIQSKALVAERNELIQLEATGCPTYGKVSWDDKENTTSTTLGVAFQSSGSYVIRASCNLPGAQEFKSSVTVVVM